MTLPALAEAPLFSLFYFLTSFKLVSHPRTTLPSRYWDDATRTSSVTLHQLSASLGNSRAKRQRDGKLEVNKFQRVNRDFIFKERSLVLYHFVNER